MVEVRVENCRTNFSLKMFKLKKQLYYYCLSTRDVFANVKTFKTEFSAKIVNTQ